MSAVCGTCRFWNTARVNGVPWSVMGECRRHAPRTGQPGDLAWPATTNGDWCGDHEFAPAEVKEYGGLTAADDKPEPA